MCIRDRCKFGVEKLRGLGNTRGQILKFPIEMAGHLYNRAGATAQPFIGEFVVSAINVRVVYSRLVSRFPVVDFYCNV